MPFLAEQGGETVVPEQVADGEKATCHDCGDTVTPRQSHYRGDTFVARHFWHPSGQPEGCEAGGESAQHERMKSVAASKARERWPDADVSLEGSVGTRRADVLVTFEDTHNRLGDGLAIEVQYRNKGKDLEATEADFHDRRHSVLWLREPQYDGKNVHFDRGEWSVWWPTEVPASDEWTGHHDVVRWLKSIKGRHSDPPVEATLRCYTDEIRVRWGLYAAFLRGKQRRDSRRSSGWERERSERQRKQADGSGGKTPPSADVRDACPEGEHEIAEGVCTRCGLGTCTLTDWLNHNIR